MSDTYEPDESPDRWKDWDPETRKLLEDIDRRAKALEEKLANGESILSGEMVAVRQTFTKDRHPYLMRKECCWFLHAVGGDWDGTQIGAYGFFFEEEAKVLAAAPKMLAACQKVRDELESLVEEDGPHGGNVHYLIGLAKTLDDAMPKSRKSRDLDKFIDMVRRA